MLGLGYWVLDLGIRDKGLNLGIQGSGMMVEG